MGCNGKSRQYERNHGSCKQKDVNSKKLWKGNARF